MSSKLFVSRIKDIRDEFVRQLEDENFVQDKSGVKVIEIVGAQFIADEDHIFGEINKDYIEREFKWYESQSLTVLDFPGGAPDFWLKTGGKETGYVNSNYGWLIHNSGNFSQFNSVVFELNWYPESRRAQMIYTRPSMWVDYTKNGANDFICTNTVQYLIRNNKLETIVNMRSNDVVFGYRNDYAWQVKVRDQLLDELKRGNHPDLEKGSILWQAGSLHIYERHFYYVDYYAATDETTVKKGIYNEFTIGRKNADHDTKKKTRS